MANYFDDKSIDEDERRNNGFQAVVAVREAITIANKSQQPLSYQTALGYIRDVDENVYDSISKLMIDKNESDTVRLYKELAEADSTLDNIVKPEDLIQKDININKEKLEKLAGKKSTSIKKKIIELATALEYFSPQPIYENNILNRDYSFGSEYHNVFTKELYSNDKYTDFKLPNNRILRLRFLHMAKEETILGADLVYEQFDLQEERVRFVYLQYKMWNTKSITIDQRSRNQILRMEQILCKSKNCSGYDGNKSPNNFRFPFCSAFFRPTSNLQNNESRLVTTGTHVPICEVQKLIKDKDKVDKKEFLGKSISHLIFEEMFNSNMIGSKWIPIDKLEEFYEQNNLLSHTNYIRLHAQEISTNQKEEPF